MRMDNDDLVVDDSEMMVYKAKPKFQIDSLSNIIIARDVSQFKTNMHSTMTKRIEDLNSSIDIRKRAGADMKLKSIHLCLK